MAFPTAVNNYKTHELFLLGARLCFGAWLLYLGITKWTGGAGGFVGYLENEFASTWLPGFLVTVTGWLILLAEPVVGLWLLVGKCQRWAWLAATLLMFILMFGQTLLQKYDVVANNWQYLILALACAALCDKGK